VFDPGPDKWDLDTLSLVSQLMNGFHGVNGTAAVTLIGELHALAAVIITGAQQDIGRLSNTESVPGDLENGGCEAVILSDVFYVGIFLFWSL
jgi:hypothetical protein